MGMLFLTSLTLVALLYAPGFLFFKALRLPNVTALVAAPIASAGAFGFLPVVYAKLGIYCTVLNVVLAPTAVFAVMFAVSWGLERRRKGDREQPAFGFSGKGDWRTLALYLACGIAVCSFTFIANLGAPDAFFSRYDNQTHLNLAQSFVDSGTWSAIDYSRYGASDPSQTPYLKSPGSFYPVTWHIVVALACLITGAKVTVASNALVAVLAAIVFPAGMFLLVRRLFPENRAAIVAGAFAAVSFASYPWVFPIKGPTLPNMLGYALMVPAMAIFIDYLEERLVKPRLLSFCLFAAASFVSLAIAHTSALFTAFVFLAPWGAHFINKRIGESERITDDKRAKARIGIIGAYVLLIIAFWAFCLTTPLLQGIVGFHHRESNSIVVAVGTLVLMNIGANSAQYAMAVVSAIGIVACIKRRIFWILVPVAYMGIGYVVARTGFEPLVTIFMGLWYSLPYRAASCLCIFLMPIAALGLSVIWQRVRKFASARGEKMPKLAARPAVASGAVMTLLAVLTFAPFCIPTSVYNIRTPFDSVYQQLREIYAQDGNRVYGAEEVAFVDKAMEAIPEGALVLNSPNDGSMFAYGVNHLNAYYRASSIKKKNETSDSKVLRAHLDEYASNPKVQEAVKSTGAHYVLQLDQGVPYEDLVKLPQFYEENRDKWVGIDRIDDGTPGFTLVLADGDMRLYRIDDLGGA